MFKEISNKKKFYAVIVLFLMLSFTAYKRSFKGAIESVSFYLESKNNIEKNEGESVKIILLKNEIQTLDNIIGKKAKNPEIVQNNILDFLNNQAQKSTLSNIDKLHVSEDNYFTIYSNIITLKGNFNELITTMYAFLFTFYFFIEKKILTY